MQGCFACNASNTIPGFHGDENLNSRCQVANYRNDSLFVDRNALVVNSNQGRSRPENLITVSDNRSQRSASKTPLSFPTSTPSGGEIPPESNSSSVTFGLIRSTRCGVPPLVATTCPPDSNAGETINLHHEVPTPHTTNNPSTEIQGAVGGGPVDSEPEGAVGGYLVPEVAGRSEMQTEANGHSYICHAFVLRCPTCIERMRR